jgi:hypothetical protein
MSNWVGKSDFFESRKTPSLAIPVLSDLKPREMPSRLMVFLETLIRGGKFIVKKEGSKPHFLA